MTILNKPEAVSDQLDQMRIMADKNYTAVITVERMDKRFAALNIKVVCWLTVSTGLICPRHLRQSRQYGHRRQGANQA